MTWMTMRFWAESLSNSNATVIVVIIHIIAILLESHVEKLNVQTRGESNFLSENPLTVL